MFYNYRHAVQAVIDAKSCFSFFENGGIGYEEETYDVCLDEVLGTLEGTYSITVPQKA